MNAAQLMDVAFIGACIGWPTGLLVWRLLAPYMK